MDTLHTPGTQDTHTTTEVTDTANTQSNAPIVASHMSGTSAPENTSAAPIATSSSAVTGTRRTGWREQWSSLRQQKWIEAAFQVLPVYIAVHLAFVVTTAFSFLFTHKDFDGSWTPLHALPAAWHHWDTGYYLVIAKYGYQLANQTAFFPLYALLERALMPFTHNDPLIAGLIISDIAGFILLVVLYQLVREDFADMERARRTILYLSLFPTAFFLASGYNESLFICLALLSFYNMRHGNWWLAGLFGFFASLTRSAGIFLIVPFCYEYLYQHEFRLQRIRFDVLGGILILCGLGVFSIYCYYRFHDFLAFSHAQAHWNHYLAFPWHGIIGSMKAIWLSGGIVSFQALRNLLDLVPDLLILALIPLIFVGPLRFPRRLWSYGIYAAVVWLFLQLFPVGGTGLFPLQSISRYLLEMFPCFIVLAAFGKSRMFHLNYLMISGALLFFLLTQFLTGHWVL